jgi:hypothetical protein
MKYLYIYWERERELGLRLGVTDMGGGGGVDEILILYWLNHL